MVTKMIPLMGKEFHNKTLSNAQSSKNIAFLPVLPESKKPICHCGRLLYGNRKINITSYIKLLLVLCFCDN